LDGRLRLLWQLLPQPSSSAAASDAPTADALTFRTYTNVNANETRVVLCGVGPKDTIVLVVHSHSALEFLVVPYLHEKRAEVLEDAAWTAGPCRDPENMLLGKQEVLDVSDGDGNCVVADVELTTGKIELGVAIAPDYMVRWSEDKLAFRTDTGGSATITVPLVPAAPPRASRLSPRPPRPPRAAS